MDRRTWRANGRVAHPDLAGHVDVPTVAPTRQCVTAPTTDVCGKPGIGRDKVLLFGEGFDVLEIHEGWAFGTDPSDGYVGYVDAAHLATVAASTHRVSVRLAHLYTVPDFKSIETGLLSFASQVCVVDLQGRYARLACGRWMMADHLRPMNEVVPDWVETAESLVGTPYLWGGNSSFGIDCSGLVQLAMRAAGRPCPRDSDMQKAAFSEIAIQELRRGDLVFWKGHVGIMVDTRTLLHANAHHMLTVIEPLDGAIARIGQKEFGAVTKLARP